MTSATDPHNAQRPRRSVSLRTAVLACVICALVAAAVGGTVAFATGGPTGPTVRPGLPFQVAGYGLTCQSTARTPNFSCSYNRPYAPTGVPIVTFQPHGNVSVQSKARPTASRDLGYWTTNFR
jgi:hypothetical protein